MSYSVSIQGGKGYFLHGKAAITEDYTETYYQYDNLFPNDSLLPHDGVYPAYKVSVLNSSNVVLSSETILIGAGIGVYDVSYTVQTPDNATTLLIELINCSIVELSYNVISASGISFENGGSISFKQGNSYVTVINGWCKEGGSWRVLKRISTKVEGEWNTL